MTAALRSRPSWTVMSALLCGALAALWPMAARADAETAGRVYLTWSRESGAETCMTREAAQVEVEHLLAREVFAPRERADRTLVVSLEPTTAPRGFAAHMALYAANGAPLGARDIAIEAASCDRATEAFTLALSIMADLPRSPEEDAPRRKETSAPKAVSPPPSPPAPTRLALGAGPAVAIHTNTSLAPGLSAFALVEPPGWMAFHLGATSTLRTHAAAERQLWLSSTRLEGAPCLRPFDGRSLVLYGCIGVQATLHVASGAGFVEDRAGLSAVFGGIAQLSTHYRLTRKLRVFATAAVALTPQRVEIAFTDRTGARRTAIDTSTVTPSLSIGLAFDNFLGRP